MDDSRRAERDLSRELSLLRESVKVNEEYWRLALEEGVDGLWQWDVQSGEVRYSGREDVFGYGMGEVATQLSWWFDHLHPADKERAKDHLEQFLQGKTRARGIEHRILCQGGTYKWVFARGRIVSRTDDGKPLRVIGIFMDISERKQAEEALRRSEFKYKALFDNANDAIVLMDGETFFDCNRRACEMMRCGREEIIGKTPYGFCEKKQVNGESSKRLIRERLGAALSGEPQFFEWRQKRPDGTTFDSEVHLNRVDLGDSSAVQAIVRDVTERKAYEKALRESEMKFRDLAEKSVVGVYLIQDEQLKYVNQRFAETLGYGMEEMMGGFPVESLTHPEDWPLVRESLRKRISGEMDSFHYEFRMLTKDGEVRVGEVYSSRTTYQGRPAVIGTVLDITERTRSHELLRQAEEKYRSIFENAVEGIFRVEADGTTAEVNRALARMSGCRTQAEAIEFLNRNQGLVPVHPERAQELERMVNEKGWAKGFELELYRRDGGIIWASVNVRAIKADDGSILRYEGTVENITKRKQAEQELTRSEAELRALVESMSDIIMVVDGSGHVIKILSEPPWLAGPAGGIHGKSLKDLLPKEGAALFLKNVRRALTIRRTVNMDHCVRAGGGEHWFFTAISPMTDGSVVCVARDITELKMAEKALQAKSARLEETNTALKVLLANVEEAKREVEETMASNIRMLVLPYIEKLSRLNLDSLARAYVDVVEENLRNVASPILHGLSKFNLTPMEIQVANYIKDGKTTKEIMTLLHISKGAVDTHRYNIRKKLGINKEKVNLCARLRAIR